MARWSLFEKRDVESLSRVLSARTLDGYRIRAKLAVNFTRLMSEAETEALAQTYAEVFRVAIEVEICEGRMPFDDVSLHRLLTERVQDVPPHRVRVNGAHLVSPSSAHSTSTSMPAVRAPLNELGGSVPPLRHPSELPRSMTPTSMRVPVATPSRAPTRRPASGVMRQEQPVTQRVASFTGVALAAQVATTLPELGGELGRAVRSAAGSLLLTALAENASQLIDPLAVLDGGRDAVAMRALVQEACISMAYVLHRALGRAGVAEKQAITVVQAAVAVALQSGDLPVNDMSRYFATDMPAEEFHRSCCHLLGITVADATDKAVSALVERLSQDAFDCALMLQDCLRKVG